MACGIFSRTGMKPMTSALAGRFLSTVPQGKSTVHISFQISVFIFFGYTPRGWIAGSYGSCISSFLRKTSCFPQWLYQFILPSTVDKVFFFFLSLHLCQHLLLVVFLMIAFLVVEVIAHCDFYSYFSDYQWCWKSFHVPIDYPYVFFGKMSFQVFCPFFDWVVWFW